MLVFFLILLPKLCISLYSDVSTVHKLTAEEFNHLDSGIWLVQFYSPTSEACKTFVDEFLETAKGVKQLAKAAVIDVDKHTEVIKKDESTEFPAFKLLGLGAPKLFTGTLDHESLVKFVFDEVKAAIPKHTFATVGTKEEKTGSVIRLGDGDFDELVLASEMPWLVAFYAPWCGHCKNLEPEWEAAAKKLEGKVKLGVLDATFDTNKAEEYKVTSYPTIKYFPPGKKTQKSATNYEGKRKGSGIVKWCNKQLDLEIPEPELIEIVSEYALKTACKDSSLSVVAFVPKLLDCQSACRQAFLDTIKKVAADYRAETWCWVWSAQGAQPRIESALDVGVLGYPTMAAVSVKKMQYHVLHGPFSYEGISEFLKEVKEGRGEPVPIKKAKLPKIESIKKWDGKDADVQIGEDVDKSKVLEEITASKEEL